MGNFKALARDTNGTPIESAIDIVAILNQAITSAGWTEIEIPLGMYIKSVYVTTRDGSNFLLSPTEGAPYATLPSGFGIDIAKASEERLFYVKGTSSTTLEVILLE